MKLPSGLRFVRFGASDLRCGRTPTSPLIGQMAVGLCAKFDELNERSDQRESSGRARRDAAMPAVERCGPGVTNGRSPADELSRRPLPPRQANERQKRPARHENSPIFRGEVYGNLDRCRFISQNTVELIVLPCFGRVLPAKCLVLRRPLVLTT
jgi:hypothetical protein